MSEDRRGRTEQDQRPPAASRRDDETRAMQLPDAETATAPLPFTGADRGPDAGTDGATDLPAAGPRRPAHQRGPETEAPRGSAPRIGPRADTRGARAGRRKARLALTHVDPWSVFVLSLIVALFLGVVLLVAVAVLYALLDGLGVLSSVDTLAQELDLVAEGQPVFGLGRVLGLTAVIAAVDIVLLTVLATLGAFLYNLCAALTGGVEVTLSERD